MLENNGTYSTEVQEFQSARLQVIVKHVDTLKKAAKGENLQMISDIERRLKGVSFSRNGMIDMLAIHSDLDAVCRRVGRALVFKMLGLVSLILLIAIGGIWYDALLWTRGGGIPIYSVIINIITLGFVGWRVRDFTPIRWLRSFGVLDGKGIRLRLSEVFFILIPVRDREHILGDLEEEFEVALVQDGAVKAYLRYYQEAATSIQPYLLRLLRRIFDWNLLLRLVRR